MTAKQRILTLKLLEKQKKYPIFCKKIGIKVSIKKLSKKDCNYKNTYEGSVKLI